MDLVKERFFLIVEDELLIAEHISGILTKAGYENNAITTTFDESVVAIEKERPVMVLTDIALGQKRSGIDLGQLLFEKYKIPFIYITSHSSPEILSKAKHTYPNAYLVKPFKKEDLIIAVELALFNSEMNNKLGEDNCLLIKDGHALARIPYSEILWLEADGNYTAIYSSNNKKRLIRSLLTEILIQLPTKDFLRVHKSYAVNRNYVTELQSAYVLLKEIKVPIGRTYRDLLLDQLK